MKLIILTCLLSLFLFSCNNGKNKDLYEPTWESLSKAKPAKWWDDGKFGIFIHWGPYSVAGYKLNNKGYAEAITVHMYQVPEKYESFFKEKFGACPPEFGYKDWIQYYTAEKWNPNEWAELFKEAGAKYVILTAEHHDGFANWNSQLTDWCATKMGPMRDLVGDLGKAVRAEGLNYGLSYHRERHPSRFSGKFIVDGTPFPLIAEEIKQNPKCEELYGPFSYSDEFIEDYVARWKELQDLYSPDFMWIDDVPIFDTAENDPQVLKFKDSYKKMIADYLNDAAMKGKEVYFNNKGKTPNFPVGVGCLERDNMNVDKINEDRWQNPATLGTSYAYMHNEEVNDLYKTPKELVRLLVDVVSKNGNLLLNIGPKADGTIPEGMKVRLQAMGKWLKNNGEAIYGTEPWSIYGEHTGELIYEDDVYYTHNSMRIHEKEYRFTKKNNIVYIIAFQKEEADFTLNSFKGYRKDDIDKVMQLDGKELEFDVNGDGLIIKSPAMAFDLANVYKVCLK